MKKTRVDQRRPPGQQLVAKQRDGSKLSNLSVRYLTSINNRREAVAPLSDAAPARLLPCAPVRMAGVRIASRPSVHSPPDALRCGKDENRAFPAALIRLLFYRNCSGVIAPGGYPNNTTFSSAQLTNGYTVVAEMGKDMKGNDVNMPANFTYGGDPTGAYAGGKIGTGAKDPSVCGTFSEAKCSIKYVK